MRVAPAHDQAEDQLIGALLLSRQAIETAVDMVGPSDFHQPARADAFSAIESLWRRGDSVTPLTVAREAKSLQTADLERLTHVAAGWSGVASLCRIVTEESGKRAVIRLADELRERAYNGKALAETLDYASAELALIDSPVESEPDGVWDSGDLAAAATAHREWVIPGLLREQHRVVFVGGEGQGKSILLTQFALMTAEGIHPLSRKPMPAVDTLYVDLENPEDELVERVRATSPCRCTIWHQPSGINLRNRRDRGRLEAVVRKYRPKLVCMGPAYKAYRKAAKENDEDVAREVTDALGDLRIRYGFAFMLEHHAPHGEGGGRREMRPRGSSLWLGWSEFGFGLYPSKGGPAGSLDLARFRGDRARASWPQRIDRDGQGGWVGRWQETF